MSFSWQLINDNIDQSDKNALVDFIKRPGVRFTQHAKVREFEKKWSEWLGVKHSTFVNSGASANWVMAAALKAERGVGEIIVSPFGWVSDVVPFLELGFTPVFVDINPNTLSIDTGHVKDAITPRTKAILVVHILGFNALTRDLINVANQNDIPIIEDCCESHGATFEGRKIGGFGRMSNFSFYFGHHMTTIEGGMVCTNDEDTHDVVRMLRSHGMTREASSKTRARYEKKFPDLNPLFTFAVPGFNVRSTELNAVIGLNQLDRLDDNISIRTSNLLCWLEVLDNDLYQTDFATRGSSNFALPLILRDKNSELLEKVKSTLTEIGVEFRLGASGGGNQARQPYLENFVDCYRLADDLNVLNHVHEFGLYVGNHTELEHSQILSLCEKLNSLGK